VRLRDALAQLEGAHAQLQQQLQSSEEQLQAASAAGSAALQEARAQVADLQRRLDDERCGNLATSTTSELMRTVRGRAWGRLFVVMAWAQARGACASHAAACGRAAVLMTPAPVTGNPVLQALSHNMTSAAQLQMRINELMSELSDVQVRDQLDARDEGPVGYSPCPNHTLAGGCPLTQLPARTL
jgi:hypothetical protein